MGLSPTLLDGLYQVAPRLLPPELFQLLQPDPRGSDPVPVAALFRRSRLETSLVPQDRGTGDGAQVLHAEVVRSAVGIGGRAVRPVGRRRVTALLPTSRRLVLRVWQRGRLQTCLDRPLRTASVRRTILVVASESDLVTLYASARPRPVVGVDDDRREEISVTRATYEEARSAVDARVPDGWQLLGLSRWPYHDTFNEEQP